MHKKWTKKGQFSERLINKHRNKMKTRKSSSIFEFGDKIILHIWLSKAIKLRILIFEKYDFCTEVLKIDFPLSRIFKKRWKIRQKIFWNDQILKTQHFLKGSKKFPKSQKLLKTFSFRKCWPQNVKICQLILDLV